MIRIIAKWFAKLAYVFTEERTAATYDLNASAAQVRAGERREAMKALNAEADAIEARVKQMTEMEEKGYWLCENGHEKADAFIPESVDDATRRCLDCKQPAKFIQRAAMSGQEKYESDKERKEAEQMAGQNRATAKKQESEIEQHEATGKSFRAQAQRIREFAELLRKL